MASPSRLSRISLLFLFLICVSPFSSATTYPTHNDLRLSSTAYLPKLQAEKLIRSLNLFPKDSVNTRAEEPLLAPGKIVEKKLKLPNLGVSGPSIEDLGHHAGYYSLPHSKAAR